MYNLLNTKLRPHMTEDFVLPSARPPSWRAIVRMTSLLRIAGRARTAASKTTSKSAIKFVTVPAVGSLQDLIRLRDLSKSLLRLGTLVEVGMILLGELEVRLFYVGVRRCRWATRNAEY